MNVDRASDVVEKLGFEHIAELAFDAMMRSGYALIANAAVRSEVALKA